MNKSVGVLSLSSDELRGEPAQVLLDLAERSQRGRLVGWGIWRDMNELFRGEPEEFFREVSEGRYGYLERGGTRFAVRQSKGTKWTIGIDTGDDTRQFIVWDLWEWAKRSPQGNETPRGLYYSALDVGRTLGVHPRHWFGPSALASPLMRQAGISSHYPNTEDMGIPEIARWALFSGRMQAVRIGVSDQPAREYDLNSAYAWGLSQVPSLRGATLREANSIDWRWFLKYGGWALFNVSWDIPRQSGRVPAPIFPFPVRSSDGIEYPRNGEGWYWSPLVKEAMEHWPDAIKVHTVLHVETENNTLPFSFLVDAYNNRQERGTLKDTIHKWALSCVWGKLCQKPQANWRSNSRSLIWAGMATSIVNAEMLRVAMIDPRRVWHFHVDSLLMDGRRSHVPKERMGEGLGQWRSRPYANGVTQYRVGVWQGRNGSFTVNKTQGIPPGLFPWDKAEDEWFTFGSQGRVQVGWREFQGFGTGSYSDWLTEAERHFAIPLQPGSIVDLMESRNLKRPGTKVQSWEPPDTVNDPIPFDTPVETYDDDFGLGHLPQRRQERFGL